MLEIVLKVAALVVGSSIALAEVFLIRELRLVRRELGEMRSLLPKWVGGSMLLSILLQGIKSLDKRKKKPQVSEPE